MSRFGALDAGIAADDPKVDRSPCCSAFEAACHDACPCGVVVAGDSSVIHGILRGTTGRDLVVDVWSEAEEVRIVPPAVVCVMFTHEGSSHAFLSRIVETCGYGGADRPRYGPVSDRATQIRVLLPESVSQLEARMSFRLPVPADTVTLTLRGPDGARHEAEILDLSRTGMQIEVDDGAIELEIGCRATVRLRCRRTTVDLAAEVRRRAGPRYGLHFVDTVHRSEVRPPAGLEQIIRHLDRRWARWRDAG